MSIKQFFSYTADYSGLETYASEAEARANVEACFNAVINKTPCYLQDELEDWCWGELRGVIRSGEVVALNARPDSEVESPRAELAALRARVGMVVTRLQEMEAHHCQGARSPAHGEYSFEQAKAYCHAVDLLKEALEAPTQAK